MYDKTWKLTFREGLNPEGLSVFYFVKKDGEILSSYMYKAGGDAPRMTCSCNSSECGFEKYWNGGAEYKCTPPFSNDYLKNCFKTIHHCPSVSVVSNTLLVYHVLRILLL